MYANQEYENSGWQAVALVVLLGCLGTPLWAQARYPVIHQLDVSDVVFQQLEEDISRYYIAVQTGKPLPPLLFYSYETRKGDDLFGVSAKLNLPYDTLATLNGKSHAIHFPTNTTLIIANTPGIFVPRRPHTELEYLMASWRHGAVGPGEDVTVFKGEHPVGFTFFPGQRFHPVERAYFLGILFRFPLPKGVITSPYGMRLDPFTHVESFHSGIDIGAPYGTDVLAAQGGYVQDIGKDREYGDFILLRHDGGYQTLYGHLSKVLVQLNERVASGMMIGKVGSTGMSTGPHLHFEIRRDGHPEDPLPLLLKGGG